MANPVKITQLPAASAVSGADLVVIDTGSATQKATVDVLRARLFVPQITVAFQASFTAGNSAQKPMFLNGFSNTRGAKPSGDGVIVAAEWAVYATDASWGDSGLTMAFTVLDGVSAIWTAPSTIATPGESKAINYTLANGPAVTSAMYLEPKVTPSGTIGETIIATLVFTIAYPQS